MPRVHRKRQLAVIEWLALLGVGFYYLQRTLVGGDNGPVASAIPPDGALPELAPFVVGLGAVALIALSMSPAWRALEGHSPRAAIPFAAAALLLAGFAWALALVGLLFFVVWRVEYTPLGAALASVQLLAIVTIGRVAIPADARRGITARAREQLGRVRS